MKIIPNQIKAGFQSARFNADGIPGIDTIELELYEALSDSKGTIREMCSHILNAGGKRIRPLLVLYSGLVFSPPRRELIQASVAAELIHMASLVHDDIIDDAERRRGKPSINQIWGKHFAVLCGDYLFAKAFGILSGNRLVQSMDFMVEAIQNMCRGEIVQADDRFRLDVSMDEYYHRIYMKTASLLECCCKSGAAAAGVQDIQIEMMGQFGLNIGYAFQIIDDILDLCGDEGMMGKPKMEDLRQGTVTLPMILLLCHDKYRPWIQKVISQREMTQETLDEICKVLKETKIIGQSFDIAVSHIEKARECLDFLPPSKSVEWLYSLTSMLQARTN